MINCLDTYCENRKNPNIYDTLGFDSTTNSSIEATWNFKCFNGVELVNQGQLIIDSNFYMFRSKVSSNSRFNPNSSDNTANIVEIGTYTLSTRKENLIDVTEFTTSILANGLKGQVRNIADLPTTLDIIYKVGDEYYIWTDPPGNWVLTSEPTDSSILSGIVSSFSDLPTPPTDLVNIYKLGNGDYYNEDNGVWTLLDDPTLNSSLVNGLGGLNQIGNSSTLKVQVIDDTLFLTTLTPQDITFTSSTDLNSNWKKIDVGLALPPEFDPVFDSISALTGTLSTIIGTISDLLSAVKNLYIAALDPFAAVLGSLLSEIEDLINGFFNSGFYYLEVNPLKIANLPNIYKKYKEDHPEEILSLTTSSIVRGIVSDAEEWWTSEISNLAGSDGLPAMPPQVAIQAACDSFNDQGDSNRPIFNEDDEVAAIGFLISAPSLLDLLTIIEKLTILFNFRDVIEFYNKLKSKYDKSLLQKISTEVITFTEIVTDFILMSQSVSTGNPVKITNISTEVDLPTILTEDSTYYLIDTGDTEGIYNKVQLAESLENANNDTFIPIGSVHPSTKFSVSQATLHSAQPNWKSLAIKNIAPFGDLQVTLNKTLNLLRGLISITNDALLDAIEVAQRKLEKLEEIVTVIDELVAFFEQELFVNITTLNVPLSTGGNTYITNELQKLDYTKFGIEKHKYSYMLLFVAGKDTASLDSLESFKSFFVI